MPGPSASEAEAGALALVVATGDFERVHFALVLASTAAALGGPVTLFFTSGALRALARPGADGRPGWRTMRTADGREAGPLDDGYAETGVATFEELLAASVELGVRFLVCEMGLRAVELSAEDLRDDVPADVSGTATLLMSLPPDGRLVFV